jgi:putative ABC transport system substrate-binding protein
VICAGNVNCAFVTKAATTTIPIVFLTAGDPVADGLVASFSRPGGNATGVRLFSAGLVAKRLQLLRELLPMASTIGFLVNPGNPTAPAQIADAQTAAAAIGVRLIVVEASDERGIDAAFEKLVGQNANALAVGADPFFSNRSEQVLALAARHRLPAVYEWHESATAGGLMSYGTVLADAFRKLGVYSGRILKGAKPADLPVLQQTRFEFVINLKTANALGLKVPPLLLAQADEVIE